MISKNFIKRVINRTVTFQNTKYHEYEQRSQSVQGGMVGFMSTRNTFIRLTLEQGTCLYF